MVPGCSAKFHQLAIQLSPVRLSRGMDLCFRRWSGWRNGPQGQTRAVLILAPYRDNNAQARLIPFVLNSKYKQTRGKLHFAPDPSPFELDDGETALRARSRAVLF